MITPAEAIARIDGIDPTDGDWKAEFQEVILEMSPPDVVAAFDRLFLRWVTPRMNAQSTSDCTCYPGGALPSTYEGPQEWCDVHGQPSAAYRLGLRQGREGIV